MINKQIVKICCQSCINAYPDKKTVAVIHPGASFVQGHVEGHFGFLDETLVIVFRGSDGKKDWIDNLKIWKKDIRKTRPYSGARPDIKVHQGFIEQYKTIRKVIRQIVESYPNQKEIIITGHSLGGALATLSAVDIKYNYPEKSVLCITFGSPRVGNKAFTRSFIKRVPRSFRFVCGDDLVCKVPMPVLGFKHISNKIQLGRKRWYKYFTGSSKDHDLEEYLKYL